MRHGQAIGGVALRQGRTALRYVTPSRTLVPVPPMLWLVEELVGRGEIAKLLGLSRQRVHELTQRRDFPEPVGHIGGRAIWRKEAVEAWAKRTGRL